ncbi:hypothetical protein ES288_D04G012600v1 [Gossypium darwinii]|uniref:Uncharacterized protein n=1 Tax=Gossypium darwinii TaxID=34276 RepID=A0A5D2CRP3_GOSDA|nr:hypothetical protein ES288_D04G012600v1 [Gossypium darwinii]
MQRCPMMKSGLQTAEAMRLHYAERKIKTMKREYVKATNGVLVLNMRFAFLAALSRMLMKLLLVRMGFPRKYMHTTGAYKDR